MIEVLNRFMVPIWSTDCCNTRRDAAKRFVLTTLKIAPQQVRKGQYYIKFVKSDKCFDLYEFVR